MVDSIGHDVSAPDTAVRELLDELPDAVVLLDADARIVQTNARADEALGYPPGSLLGLTPAAFMEGGSDVLNSALSEADRSEMWKGDLNIRLHSGEIRIAACRLRARRDENSNITGYVAGGRDVTDRRHSESDLRALFTALADPVFIIDRDGTHHSVGFSGRDLLYVRPENIVGRTIHELMPPELRDRMLSAVHRALDGGETVEVDYALAIRGATRQFRASVSPMDANRVVWVARDRTERKEAEQRLRTQTQYLRDLLNAIPDHAWMKDIEGRYLIANDGYLEAWGLTLEQLAGRTDADLFGSEDARLFEETDQQVIRTGERCRFDHHMVQHGQVTGWFEVVKVPLFDGDGRVNGTVGISHDITARRSMEVALRETEERFLQLAENIPQAFWIADVRDGRVLYTSPAFEKMWGIPSSDLQQSSDAWLDYVHPDDRPCIRELFETAREKGKPWEARYRLVRPDNEIRWIFDRAFPIGASDGPVSQYAGVAEDITEQREVERVLERQAMLFRSTNEAVIYVDSQGVVTDWNPGAEKVFGYTSLEAVGGDLYELLAPIDPMETDRYLAALREKAIWTGEQTFRRRDEGKAICEVVLLPVYQRGQIDGAILIARDITERRSLEEQLRQSQKLEGIGRLAGGIAHDFNNMLLAIQGFATLLREEVPNGSDGQSYVAEIQEAVEKSTRLTRQLLAYSRRQILRTEIFDLSPVARSFESILRRMIGEDVVLSVETWNEPLPVEADRSQLEQVLVNLVVNARDAMPTGGRLTVTTGIEVLMEGDTRIHEGAEPGRYAMLDVADTGIGMDEATLEVAFEPFFTTKPAGEGTGLGLSMVYGIVKQFGGFLWATSEPGVGTSIRILLPLVDAVVGGSDGIERDPDVEPETDALILVVEDEAALRRLIKLILERGGYRVVTAASGDEARAEVSARGSEFSLALIDVVLRGESGRVVAEHFTERCPDAGLIFMSGYMDDQLLRHGIRQSEHRFLQKPIRPERLLAEVRETLAERSAG